MLSSATALASKGGSEMSWLYAELVHALDGGGIVYLERLVTLSTRCGCQDSVCGAKNSTGVRGR